jgi:hypothetical protein
MKTLIGKSGYLFLINDDGKELEIHCDNLCRISDVTLSRYTFSNYYIFVYPDKSYLYKQYLPDQYVVKYRPAFDIYKAKFNENCIDLTDCLQDGYYKTDTHIHFKGSYSVYKKFIETIQVNYAKEIHIDEKECELSSLHCGLGDLTWYENLGEQKIDATDTYYFNAEYSFYCQYTIIDGPIRFLTYALEDITIDLLDKVVNWEIISSSIIYIQNNGPKVIIFYDSFLLQSLKLYFDLFEVYFIKSVYDPNLITTINPDFVFEFRIERFLF